MSRSFKASLWVLMALALTALALYSPTMTTVRAQQPTGSIPTVTGTPLGPMVTVNQDVDLVYVRAGPSSFFYPKIGVLLRGESAPALGRSEGGGWIMIRYDGVPGNVGWIYGANVSLSSQSLPLVQDPPTPTPRSTPTINPTLVAAFVVPQTPTRLATFTPAAPQEVPAFGDETVQVSRVPFGLIIFGLVLVGGFVAVISFLRGR